MTYSDGMLWVGEFKDKGDSSGRMYSYTISSDAKKLTKKYYITLPDRTQGAAFKNGYLMLTRSYSRNISGSTYISEMRIYKYSKVDTSTGNIKKNDAVKVFQLPPMVEAVVAGSTYVYTLYESAATKYYTGSDGSGKCKYPTDRIAAFRFSDMIGGSGSSSGWFVHNPHHHDHSNRTGDGSSSWQSKTHRTGHRTGDGSSSWQSKTQNRPPS